MVRNQPKHYNLPDKRLNSADTIKKEFLEWYNKSI